MTRHLPSYRRARGEDGVALVWALAFMVLVGVVVFFVLGYVTTSIRSTNALSDQRSALYNVDGAVNNAIRYVQNDSSLSRGAINGQPCNFTGTGANGVNALDVSVSCTPIPGSGVPLGTSSAPGFAILTMAPYHGQAPTSGCVNVNNELGIVQVQNSKLLQVTGNVYVNSDADSDVWSGGCPQTSTAEHIKVTGNVRQAESCHDLDVVQPVPAVTPPYTIVCGSAFSGATVGSTPAAADPATVDPASWAPSIATAPPTRSVPACPSGMLVTFQPGTYTDATGLTNLMNGTTCPGRLFWFAPGNYYFNFSNNGGVWTIDDPAARIVGGAANAVPSGAMPIGPLTVAATAMASPATSSPGYNNTSNARVIGETPTALSATTGNFTTSNQTRWITSTGYAVSPQIPGGSSGLTVNARMVHSETYGNPTQVGALQLLVRNQADTATLCSVDVPPSATSGATTDVTIPLPATCGLDTNALNAGAFSLRYQITHLSCGGGPGNPACADVSSSLDGVELQVSYTQAARAAWDPTNPSTVTAGSPTIPGACVHDGDYGFNTGSGVQFVFGGTSHVNLKSGSFELCDSFSSTHQEIVMYGVRSASSGTPVGPVTWTPQDYTNGGNGFTNPANGRVVDGSLATARVTSGVPTRTMTLTEFSPTAAFPVPGANQIPAGSTIDSVVLSVTHRESNTGQTQPPTVDVTPFGAGACGASALSEHTGLSADTVDLTDCLDTPDKINGGVSVLYTARRKSSSPTEYLDGMSFGVIYTPPVVNGSLNGESGCVTQAPYYSPQNHSPAYNGACALFSVASNANGGHSPRVAAFWGTVYAPSAALDVPVDILTVPVFNRGVVARMLMLGYNLAADASVPITTTPITANAPANRRAVFTATVPGKSTSLVADVEFCDTACDATHAARHHQDLVMDGDTVISTAVAAGVAAEGGGRHEMTTPCAHTPGTPVLRATSQDNGTMERVTKARKGQ